ncbi:MAG: YerC/YecD family TrpR-related protein [Lachnospiraceae bacterium]|nr:YerC/YecD family TrpR-related protein [Lachnospiraceae bacterium]
MNKKIRTKAVCNLFQGILSLQNEDECFDFFEDLCTVNELLSLSQRYEVAHMLKLGHTYMEIAEETGASTATISRVNRSLNYGNDGYELIFNRLYKDEMHKNSSSDTSSEETN